MTKLKLLWVFGGLLVPAPPRRGDNRGRLPGEALGLPRAHKLLFRGARHIHIFCLIGLRVFCYEVQENFFLFHGNIVGMTWNFKNGQNIFRGN